MYSIYLLGESVNKINREKIVKLLLENGADANALDLMKQSSLHMATQLGKIELNRMLHTIPDFKCLIFILL